MELKIVTIDNEKELEFIIDLYSNNSQININESKEILEKYFKENSTNIFICEDKNNYFGFLVFEIKKEKGELNLRDLHVNSQDQSKGIGKFMMNNLKQNLLKFNLSKITLEVSKKDMKAKKFYLRENFKLVKTGSMYEFYEFKIN